MVCCRTPLTSPYRGQNRKFVRGCSLIASLTNAGTHQSIADLQGLERYIVLGDVMTLLLTAQETQGEFTLYHVASAYREDIATPLHVHPIETQYYRVMEGVLGIQRGDVCTTVSPGEIVVVPAGVPHRTWTASHEPCTCLVLITPGGIETSMRRIGIPAPHTATPQPLVADSDIELVCEELFLAGMTPATCVSE